MHIKDLQMENVSNKLKLEALGIYQGNLSSLLDASSNELVLLSHFGNLNQPKITSLINIVEQATLENGIKRRIMKRVCSVMIESLQNISIHGALDRKGNQNAMIILTFNGEEVKIITGNLIHNEDVGVVDYKLTQINKLSLEELRKLYIETLCNENFSQKGGAGLGFLTVAKKVALPIEYELVSIDENQSYFVNTLRISTEVS